MFNIRVQKSTLNDDKFPFNVKAGFHMAMLTNFLFILRQVFTWQCYFTGM